MDTPHICQSVQPLNSAAVTQVKGNDIKLVKNKEKKSEHLNVFVVLHSHVDAGWLNTFDEYYNASEKPVRDIMNNVVNSLRRHQKLKFIWSEASFLEKWWTEANQTYREYFKKLVKEGRLEISTGSWVMADEATPYFWESIENIIVGNQYIQEILNITPTTAWSVDPFGHGLMMPYLLTLSGMTKMVIGRIHYNIKNILRQNHQLHFRWAQLWDSDFHWMPFVNVLPKGYYTVSDACGVNNFICCQFDVATSARSYCRERAKVNTCQEIAIYGERMADQYRSLQTFYNSDSVLVAAGDDFAYSYSSDLEIVYQVQFGTIKDYFDSLRNSSHMINSPILTGDFFPYTDSPYNDTSLWTGFYNHRAYFKRFVRIVQSELRLMDFISVAVAMHPKNDTNIARRNLALSLHHDAITGTSKRYVMDDYTSKLRASLQTILMEQERLLNSESDNNNNNNSFLRVIISNSLKLKGMQLTHRTLTFANGIKRYGIQIVNQKGLLTTELIKLNITNCSVIAKHRGEALTIQLVQFPQETDLFEVTIIKLIYNDGSVNTTFGLNFNKIVDQGGAYIMVAQFPFQDIDNSESMPRVVRGPVYSSIWKRLSDNLAYSLTVINSTDNSARAIQVDVFTDVVSMPGYTFFMNLNTKIENKQKFYTDVNGMYLIQRKYHKTIALEANIYPMTTQAMIEDESLRCSIVAAQSTGVTSTSGTVLLMVDREIYLDDGKGLNSFEAGQSYPSHLKYRIIFESKLHTSDQNDDVLLGTENKTFSRDDSKHNTIYHSQLVQKNLEELLYPAAVFFSANVNLTKFAHSSIALPPLPDNIQLVTARYITQKKVLISLRWLPYDCTERIYLNKTTDMMSKPTETLKTKLAFQNLIRQFFTSLHGSIYESNLSGTKIGDRIITPQSMPLYFVQPLHIVSFIIIKDNA
ncbi:unnamed protein product [Thelazia callipaeda]|uniref:Alpha-mann_mid domain-containing protein n=1 Tax=Thelazia callipaeda TaxID=103827 RepID=A0A0N5CLK8_THECL|nr:unnamed protein product [Thelazia callipaeda]